MNYRAPIRHISGFSTSQLGDDSTEYRLTHDYNYFMTQDELMEHLAERAEAARKLFRKYPGLKRFTKTIQEK